MDMFEYAESTQDGARIRVIGIGGGGGNAVDNMISMGLGGVEFISANTDAQALRASKAPKKIQIGMKITGGRGAGSNPEIGRRAAEEDRQKIKEYLVGSNMVFITAGMGGGTGTGAAPICAEIAREIGALSVAVVTKPFHFENKRRMEQAEAGIRELEKHVDTLISIPNQRLLELSGKSETLLNAFKHADEVLYFAVRGIAELITVRGLINLDFSDVRTIMEETGMAFMGTGEAEGKNKGIEAAKRAVTSPLLEDVSICGATGVLVNLTGGESMTMEDVEGAMSYIQGEAHQDSHIIFGSVIDKKMKDRMMVTVIATGFQTRSDIRSDDYLHVVPAAASSRPDLDTPTFIRKEREQLAVDRVGASRRSVPTGDDLDSEYDIPTFMRKKAD